MLHTDDEDHMILFGSHADDTIPSPPPEDEPRYALALLRPSAAVVLVDDDGAEEWRGELGEFLDANPEEEIDYIERTLVAEGCTAFGGGAQPVSSLWLADAWTKLRGGR